MSTWSLYEARKANAGTNKYEATQKRENRFLETKAKENLSFFTVKINERKQNVSIINSDNLNEKFIISTSNNTPIIGGSLVEWMDNRWLVTEVDANNIIYSKAKMVQCNYLLKWVDEHDNIFEQWCVVGDGTKYLTGVYEDRNFVVTRGDSRITLNIAKNTNTAKFNRETRFLIDDSDANPKIAYSLTKPLKVGSVYNNTGVYSFILQEVVSTEYDNHKLGIADYYKHFPKQKDDCDCNTSDKQTSKNDAGWF